jgi:hypothetical protein
MVVTFNPRGIDENKFQRDEITFNQVQGNAAPQSQVKIPSDYQSTSWKVVKIATLWLVPLFYTIGKGCLSKIKLAFSAIHDGGKIYKDNLPVLTENPNANIVIGQLNEMKLLADGSAYILKDTLPADNSDRIFISIPTMSEFQEKLRGDNPIIIPVVFKGGFFTRGIYSRRHITTLIIDPVKHEIIYIDPKGETLADHASHAALDYINQPKGDTSTIAQVFERMIDAIKQHELGKTETKPQNWTLIQNRSQDQTDGYNCGVYFLHNARSYASDGKLPDKQLKCLADIRSCRKTLIDTLLLR